MPKQLRLTLTEMIWLILAGAITIVICNFLFFIDTRHWTADLHMHDTYFVLNIWHVLIPVFLFMAFLIYFIKEAFKKYSRTLANGLMLFTGFILIVLFALINKELVKMGTTIDLTDYPPLSDLSKVQPKLDPTIQVISNVLTVLQLIVTVFLMTITFFWGKNKQSS